MKLFEEPHRRDGRGGVWERGREKSQHMRSLTICVYLSLHMGSLYKGKGGGIHYQISGVGLNMGQP
jgi:hypothetical protein